MAAEAPTYDIPPSWYIHFLLIRIEVLVLLGVTGLLVLVVLGSYRRRSSRGAVKLTIWVVYAVSIPMVNYTIGLMQSCPIQNSFFSVWAVSLLLFLSSADSFSAYSLGDNNNWKRFYVQQTIQAFWVGILLAWTYYGGVHKHKDFRYPLWTIYAITLLKSGTRVLAFKAASTSTRNYLQNPINSTKLVADYMSYEHELSGTDYNPATMQGYRYVVAGDHKEGFSIEPPRYVLKPSSFDDGGDVKKLVTVQEIWKCNGSLLSGSAGNRLKDVCLSMALSKMLYRRFVGFEQLGESNLKKTRDFLFLGLLHGHGYCERAFRVVEVELAFMHDYFYTKYFVIHFYHHRDIILSCAMIPFCSWLAYKLFHHFLVPAFEFSAFRSHNRNYDALVTCVIVIGIALVEALQVFLYLASGWCKVSLVTNYVVRGSWNKREWVSKLIGCITSLRSFHCWENKLGQYILLERFNYKPKNIVSMVTCSLIDKTRQGCKQGKRARLSMDVKEAVMENLKQQHNNGGELITNGVTSLQANGVLQLLSWSCTNATNLPTTTHTILAWHIATSICEAHDDDPATPPPTSKQVACDLSKYCAYLVAFAPELLPDHCLVSQSIFGKLVDELQVLLKGLKTLQQRCQSLKEKGGTADPGHETRLSMLGGCLGYQLIREIEDPTVRWKVLHDFWAEMMLYVAPSNDARAHLETLPSGGEFITHLWALLTHGGILERATGPRQNV